MSISAAVIWLAAGSLLFAADPDLGTWKLNVAKSKYSPGPAPKSGNRDLSRPAGDAVKRTGDTTLPPMVRRAALTYTAKFGRQVLSRSPAADLYDEISIKKIDDHNTEADHENGAGKACG